ncbi:toxin-antitoxin system YwqK family antitoxin [Paenibacillus sp. NPDC058071]|uniref:toxin-antitoxin system YwqK family antitoxin n=1 Tax=Paenibacillus sp. NPDC058071 TaxID=3346326 RepID=UPI0036D8335F
MEEKKMNELNILTASEVMELGIEFIEDVCYSGEYGQQVFNKPMEEGGTAITGLLYEKRANGALAYYSFYENGIPHGVTVWFYQSGKVREHTNMERGTTTGRSISWFESGKVKSVTEKKYGFKVYGREWDENGNSIEVKNGPTDFEKIMITKYDS